MNIKILLEKEHLFKYSFFDNFDLTDVLKTENIPFPEIQNKQMGLKDIKSIITDE